MKVGIKHFAATAVMALLASQAQAAVTVNCPGTAVTTDREFKLTTDAASTCVAYGVGNLSGGADDPFIAANPLYSLLDKDENPDSPGLVELAFSVTGLGAANGTFTLASSLWSTYSSLAFALKSGGGQANPDWAVFSLASGTESGQWSITSPGNGNGNGNGGGQQSLSHANLYGILKTPGNDVPEPSTVALLAASLLAVGAAARRRRSPR